MVRETRYLWVGNLPDKVTEEKISQHFERYGKIQSVKILADSKNDKPCATVAFMDIKSAAKAHNTENKLDGIPVVTEYFEPSATGAVTITRTADGDTVQRGPAPSTSGTSFASTPSTSKSGGRAGASGAPFPGRSDSSELEEPRSHDRPDYNYEGRRQNSYEENDYEQRGRSKQRFPQTPVGRSNYNQRQSYEGREGRGQFETSTSLERANSAAGNGGVTVPSSVSRTTKPQWGSRSPARSSDSLPRSSRHGRRSTSRSPAGSRSSSGSSSSRSSSRSSRSRSQSSKASRDHMVGGGTPTTSVSSVVTKKDPSASANQNSENKSGERQDLGIKIRGLPVRSSDTSLRDGLLHEYKKHGKVTSVNVFGSGDGRYAIVSFKRPQEAQKALEASQNKMFFRTRIVVETHEGFGPNHAEKCGKGVRRCDCQCALSSYLGEVEDDDFEPPEAKLDEYHPKATRTLFVGNLEKEISTQTLRDTFKPFGEIIDIDIKKQGAVSAYAFVQYSDITSVVKALHKMDGEHIGNNRIKLGFGKSMPMNCVWLDNVIATITDKYLVRTFGRYGPVSHSVIDTVKGRALIYFENMDFAQVAVNEMRGRVIGGKKIQIDFASRDCQTAFFQKMEETNQLRPGERPDERWAARLCRSGSAGSTFKHQNFEEPEFDAKTAAHTSKTFTPYTNSTASTRGRNNFPQRGNRTNNVRGQRISSSRSSTYENFEEYRRTGRSFEEYSEGSTYLEDSFEQELRDYGYRQQERQNLGDSTSPQRRNSDIRRVSPFPRVSRHPSPSHERGERYEDYPNDRYPERFRDSDSQSGEKESVRSFHSQRSTERRAYRDRQYDEPFTERYLDEKQRQVRGFSPASSEFSHKSRSPGRYRASRSPSPVGKHKLKDRLGSPVRENYPYKDTPSQHGSPVDYDYKDSKVWDGKSQRSKEEGQKVRDLRERCDSEERTSITLLMGKIATLGDLKPRKTKLESEENLSDTDTSKNLEGVMAKRRSIEELEKTEGGRRDKQRPRSMSTSGSRTRLNDVDHVPSSLPSQDSASSSAHSTTADPPRPKIGSAVTKPKKSKKKKVPTATLR